MNERENAPPSVNPMVNGSCESSSEQASQRPRTPGSHLCPEMFFVAACVLTGMEAWDRRLPEAQLSHYGTSFLSRGREHPMARSNQEKTERP